MLPAKLSSLSREVLDRLGLELSKRPRPDADEVLYAEYSREVLARKPFLNIGAGKFEHRYWTNVDYASDWYRERLPEGFVHYDLTAEQPLPFADGSVELVYSSHTFEHVGNSAVANVLRESFRVLRAGGGIRITCPDAALFYQTAAEGKRSYWEWRRSWFLGAHSTAPSFEDVTVLDCLVSEVATPRCRFYRDARAPIALDELQRRFDTQTYGEFLDGLTGELRFDGRYAGDHINWWDEAKLTEQLRAAGFTRVRPSRKGQSLWAPMSGPLFDSTAPMMSLYVEATKP